MPKMITISFFCIAFWGSAAFAQPLKSLSLEDCIEIALKKNRQRAVSEAGLNIAKAHLGQARSAYWPQINTNAMFARLDEVPVFVFPEETDTYSIGGVLPQPIVTEVTIPEKEIQLLGQNLFTATANITLPLYIGGLRHGLMQQAHAGMEVARQNTRRTDQEIIYQIRRLYFGAVLANKLAQMAQETLDRLTVTLELTENLYQRGSGKVKKTDYLKNKMFVESVRGFQFRLQEKADNARTGLTFYMGLDWQTEMTLSETEVPIQKTNVSLKQLISGTLRFSPNWLTLQAGLEAYDGKIQEAKSETRPRLALMGNLEYINNNYNKGVVAPQNKRAWQVGLGLELPLFNGFRTHHKVKEMKARLAQLEHQEVLLREGLAIQTKVLFRKLMATQQHIHSAKEALDAAQENRRLTELGYQADILETQDVVEAQISESIIEAQYNIVLYDHYQTRIQIEQVIGTEIERLLNE
ncbi:MAG: outer membrane protein [Candidatus Latescibacterota bacterium]|jgi:outer membrane protein